MFSSGSGITNSSGGILRVTNSVIWGNSDSSDQISNFATAFIESSAVTDLSNITFFDSGGNIELSASDDIFASPEPATNAPTTSGDYRLIAGAVVINQGDIEAISDMGDYATDFEGEDRFQYVNLDMGADEVDFCTSFFGEALASNASELIQAMACANSTAQEDIIIISEQST